MGIVITGLTTIISTRANWKLVRKRSLQTVFCTCCPSFTRVSQSTVLSGPDLTLEMKYTSATCDCITNLWTGQFYCTKDEEFDAEYGKDSIVSVAVATMRAVNKILEVKRYESDLPAMWFD